MVYSLADQGQDAALEHGCLGRLPSISRNASTSIAANEHGSTKNVALPMQASVRGRFAPSPTGDLHFGSLVTALGSWLRARSRGGAWIVRMEDIDPMRAAPGSGERIVAALNAFGLVSDEAIVWQSDRLDLYESAFNALNDRAAIYPCHCSRRDLVQLNNHQLKLVG